MKSGDRDFRLTEAICGMSKWNVSCQEVKKKEINARYTYKEHD